MTVISSLCYVVHSVRSEVCPLGVGYTYLNDYEVALNPSLQARCAPHPLQDTCGHAHMKTSDWAPHTIVGSKDNFVGTQSLNRFLFSSFLKVLVRAAAVSPPGGRRQTGQLPTGVGDGEAREGVLGQVGGRVDEALEGELAEAHAINHHRTAQNQGSVLGGANNHTSAARATSTYLIRCPTKPVPGGCSRRGRRRMCR